eukprot:m.77021 g.77021  ORF g.77021 m.77021 type:complete len:186 (-) comp10576_c0_seq3:331-888(-)
MVLHPSGIFISLRLLHPEKAAVPNVNELVGPHVGAALVASERDLVGLERFLSWPTRLKFSSSTKLTNSNSLQLQKASGSMTLTLAGIMTITMWPQLAKAPLLISVTPSGIKTEIGSVSPGGRASDDPAITTVGRSTISQSSKPRETQRSHASRTPPVLGLGQHQNHSWALSRLAINSNPKQDVDS